MSRELLRLSRLSAPFTHAVMNRRYEGLAFLVTGEGVEALAGLAADHGPFHPSKKVKLLCSACFSDGEYCAECGGAGYVPTHPLHLTRDSLLYERVSPLS